MCKSGEGAYLSRVPFLRAGLPRPPFRRFQWVPGGPSGWRAKKTCLNRGTNPPCALESINRFWTSSGHESALRSNQRSVAGGIPVSRGQQRSPPWPRSRAESRVHRAGTVRFCAQIFSRTKPRSPMESANRSENGTKQSQFWRANVVESCDEPNRIAGRPRVLTLLAFSPRFWLRPALPA